ncbi:MAG: ribonuclease III, partial [Planctomycetes bacterium]|nr:ribonuclease III [Planctomycetota bacterium]
MAKRDSSRAKFSASVIQDLGAAVGHAFTNHALVREALTHSSVKTDEQPSNERLEFFGDAVLGLAVTEMIFHEFPEF